MATKRRSKLQTKTSSIKTSALKISKTSSAGKAALGSLPARPVIRLKKIHFFILTSGILLIGLLFALRGFFVAATVNGQPIGRFSINSELEQLYGKNSLEQRITSAMIFQEAGKKGVVISDADIEKEYKKSEDTVKKQGQELKQVLASRGYTPETYKSQIKIQKIAEKLFEKDVKVSDKEVEDYLTQNKENLPQDAKPEDLRKNAELSIRQQKIYTKYQAWVDDLRKKAKINYFVDY